MSSTITKVIVHPAIGVARVGDSPDQYFLAPEVVGQSRTEKDDFRDAEGRIKRQAARFRLYGLNDDGNVIKELTADDGVIEWTVHVANKKSAWYKFELAFDIPVAKGDIKGYKKTDSALRNAAITGADRKRLLIDPGPISITGKSTNEDGKEADYAFDKGTFFSPGPNDTPVYLGELRTDKKGRLIFLGGRGLSASYNDTPATDFANSDTWHDDTSDGPVEAKISFADGRQLVATGAWVVTAPPDYAPGVRAFATGYDLVYQAALEAGYLELPDRPSFWEHIYPIFERLPLNQWVNTTIFIKHGWGNPGDFSSREMIHRLSDRSQSSLPLRQSIFSAYRDPAYKVIQGELLPPIYGDGIEEFSPDDTDPRNFMALLPFQYHYLKMWADGDFTLGTRPGEMELEELSAGLQTLHLDRAALDETIGGPFHPGCEFTWPMRNTMMYDAPFRIRRRKDNPLDFGPSLDSEKALAVNGPLDGSVAGSLTMWMAVPWQTDTSSCLSGYAGVMGEYVPTFWPARVPNDVLTAEDYKEILSAGNTAEQKLAAFSNRRKWLRGVAYTNDIPAKFVKSSVAINAFVSLWSKIAIVVQKKLHLHSSVLPDSVWVETGRQIADEAAAVKTLVSRVEAVEPQPDDKGYMWMIERARKRKTEK